MSKGNVWRVLGLVTRSVALGSAGLYIITGIALINGDITWRPSYIFELTQIRYSRVISKGNSSFRLVTDDNGISRYLSPSND